MVGDDMVVEGWETDAGGVDGGCNVVIFVLPLVVVVVVVILLLLVDVGT